MRLTRTKQGRPHRPRYAPPCALYYQTPACGQRRGVVYGKRGAYCIAFWAFPGWRTDAEVLACLRSWRYVPEGFEVTDRREFLFGGPRRVHPAQLRRRGSRVLVMQRVEVLEAATP